MINGFYISFFLVRKHHKHLYTMTEIGAITVASSLSDLHSIASLKHLDMLSKIGRCFWKHCNITETTDVESICTDDESVVPISDFMPSLTNPVACHHDIETRSPILFFDTMDIMDQYPEFKCCYLVLDNTQQYIKSKSIELSLTEQGYLSVYLPPHSPELNRIQ
ncbi:unnamed protein product [Absidia cylindrospora]